MFVGFGYAVTALDGRGNHVKSEDAAIDDLNDCYDAVLDFTGTPEGDALFGDALDSLYVAHQAADQDEPSITWEVRCMPLLRVI